MEKSSQKWGVQSDLAHQRGIFCNRIASHNGSIKEKEMYVYVTRNIIARMRRHDGTDKGNFPLNPGKYQANKTNDGALEILQEAGEPVYLLPFIWWEQMELGDILIAA
jgi:hypothetical protein